VWRARRDEVDLQRSALERLLREEQQFGSTPELRAQLARITFYFLHLCSELEDV
jgi:hypothetical protein